MIINNFLDNDMYKFTMSQFILSEPHLADRRVTFKYHNRGTPFDIAGNLEQELNHLKNLRPTDEELDYLLNLTTSSFFNPDPKRVFSPGFIHFLSDIHFNDIKIEVFDSGNIYVSGPWEKVTFFEVPILAIISELRAEVLEEGITHIAEDIDHKSLYNFVDELNNNRSLRFSDFGTRRRKSYRWHDTVLRKTLENLNDSYHLSGTSNLHFAMKYGLRAVGTFAHELPMGIAGLVDDPRDVYPWMMDQWKKLYGNSLNILLPDTFTSDWLFDKYGYKVVEWEGVRHDSGNPYEFADKYIQLLETYSIDPMKRVIVFSDGLNIHEMKGILEYCRGRVWSTFGVGTKFTHNTLFKPPNIVMKMNSIEGNYTVKLSDDLGKNTGDIETVEKYKKLFEVEV